ERAGKPAGLLVRPGLAGMGDPAHRLSHAGVRRGIRATTIAGGRLPPHSRAHAPSRRVDARERTHDLACGALSGDRGRMTEDGWNGTEFGGRNESRSVLRRPPSVLCVRTSAL